jgi:hypothetical protein
MACRALRIQKSWFGSTTVLFLAAAIVLMVGLSAAPNLHERLHPTAGSLHECAVTLIAFGSCHHGAAAPLLIAPTTTLHLSKVRGSWSTVGRIAISCCARLRARATRGLLIRWFFPHRAGGGVHCVSSRR